MNAIFLFAVPKPIEISNLFGYLICILIALLVFGYLIYSLIKPEKF